MPRHANPSSHDHQQQRRDQILAGSMLGVIVLSLFTPSLPFLTAGAVIGGLIGAFSREPESKEDLLHDRE